MKKISLILVLALIGGLSLASNHFSAAYPLVALAQEFSGYLNIRVGDGVDNLNPVVTYNNQHNEYLVVWWEEFIAANERSIYAQRVDGNGNLTGSQPIVVEQYSAHWNWQPDVVYNPTRDEYLVVYTYETGIGSGNYDIWAVRLSWEGNVIPPQIWVDSTPGIQQNPAVAYNRDADEYLVVWDSNQGPATTDIWARRIAGDGTMPGGAVNIATSQTDLRTFPDVAYDPGQNQYLIAYTYQDDAALDGNIYSKLVSWNLGIQSSEIKLVDNSNPQGDVALAASENEYLAVWTDGPNTSWRTIYGRRINGDGSLPGVPFLIAEYMNREMSLPTASYAASYGYLVTWHYGSQSPSQYDIYGSYIIRGQDQPSGEMFAIDGAAENQGMPDVACNQRGDCLVVYNDDDAIAGDWEIRGRFVWPHRVYLPAVLRTP